MLVSKTVTIFVFLILLAETYARNIRSTKNGGCPKNAIFKECTNVCPPKSCATYQQVSSCFSLRCGPPGCMCKEGHVLLNSYNKDEGCVSREFCGKLDKLQTAQQNLNKQKISA